MPLDQRIDASLARALSLVAAPEAPPRLASALPYAIFPGGARIRPTILLSVALACGDDRPGLADAAAAALELIHCASLVHDDLPCFDDAALRRGKVDVGLYLRGHLLGVGDTSPWVEALDKGYAQASEQRPGEPLALQFTLGYEAQRPFHGRDQHQAIQIAGVVADQYVAGIAR